MEKSKRNNLIGQLLLLAATVVWGSSFAILKETINEVPKIYVIGVRFIACGIIVVLIFIKKLIKIDKKTLVHGLILGAIVAGAYLTQTYGLSYSSPSTNAFLTATYVIICPFLMWLLCKRKPKGYNVVAAVLCLIGIGFISFTGGSEGGTNVFIGSALTLVGAIFYALQIIYTDKFQQDGFNSVLLLTVQFLTVGALLLAFSAAVELPQYGIEKFALRGTQLTNVLYLTLACTLFAQGAQMFGQKLASSPTQSSIILSLEAVFGAIFSVLLGAEKLSVTLICGFVIIFIAIMIGELKLDVFKPFRKKKACEAVKDGEKK